MPSLIILNLGIGDCSSGFPAVTAHLWEGDNPHPMKFVGALPPAPQLPMLYHAWKMLYVALTQRLEWAARIQIDEADVTNVSETELQDLCQQLTRQINRWLNSEKFRPIDQALRTRLVTTDEIRVLIETNDVLLRRLPWHVWSFLDDYPNAEIALSTQTYQRSPVSPKVPAHQSVNILAILGNSQGINVQQDQVCLAQLAESATIDFLVEPSLEELHHRLWQGCHLLFFAGHSGTHWDDNNYTETTNQSESGFIGVNQRDRLSIAQLKYALKRSIDQGLQLAIFNSCDGLGLAQQLADLNIPQVIVMRESIPDLVAHTFLKHFLTSFVHKKSLYIAVREAREQLQGIEQSYPCASWLPVICQNPAIAPRQWQDCCLEISQASQSIRPSRTRPKKRQSKYNWLLLGGLCFAIIFLVLGIRWSGWLQSLELHAYDQFVRLRLGEASEQRVLVITVTENDLKLPTQKHRKGSLSDLALQQLLNQLLQYQPRAIGLDIYRDFPAPPETSNLATQLSNEPKVFTVCKTATPEVNDPGVAPPPEVPLERQGFSNVVKDSDGVIRRYLIGMEAVPTSSCLTSYALSAKLVFHYFSVEGVSAQFNRDQQLQIGAVTFPRLQSHWGGYQGVDAWGYQVLLNYRTYHSSLNIVPTLTLEEALSGQLTPQLVRDRIVLIGTTASSFQDYHLTPYSSGHRYDQQMPGVIVQAQMVSYLISAVKDGRSPTQVWPIWAEAVWIWGWALIAGLLSMKFRSPVVLLLAIAALLSALYSVSFFLFLKSFWVPLIPPLFAVIITSFAILIVRFSYTTKSKLLLK